VRDAPTLTFVYSSSRPVHIFTRAAVPSHSHERLLAPVGPHVRARFREIHCPPRPVRQTVGEIRLRHAARGRPAPFPAFVLLSPTLQPLLSVISVSGPGPGITTKPTRRSTSLHHHHHCDTGCACHSLDTCTPSWTTLVYWQFDSTTPHTLALLLQHYQDCHPIETRSRWNSGHTNTRREQDYANRKLRFTGRLLPTNLTAITTLITHIHHMYR